MLRISLRKMLIFVGLAAALFALATEIGMGTAKFEIVENDLALNEDQLVSGRIWGSFFGPDQSHQASQLPFVCEVRNINQPQIIDIPSGQKDEVRYRVSPLWPLKKQDPFEIYLRRHLGISADEIEGYVWTKAGARVVIDGTQ